MNTGQINNQLVKAITLFAKNLTSHSDENFKIAQLIEFIDGTIMFDLRNTFKGKLQNTGITLYISEFEWLKRKLVNDSINVQLEHNSRLIRVNKTSDELSITLRKSNGKLKTLSFKNEEMKNLIEFILIFEEKLKSLAIEKKFSFDFSEISYYKESIIN